MRGPRIFGLALALAACSGTHAEVDASPTARSAAPVVDRPCSEPTPLEDFDAFVAQLGEAGALHPARGNLPRIAGAPWDYTRTRIAIGAVVLDPERASECVRALREDGDARCEGAVRPRCPVHEGDRCGRSDDCEPEMWCEAPALPAWCQRAGRCRMRIPIGQACPRLLGEGCEAPGPGFDGSACLASAGHASVICTRFRFRTVEPGGVCVPLMTSEPSRSHPEVEHRVCGDGHVCIAGRCEPRPAPAAHLEHCDGLTVDCAPDLYCDAADSLCHHASEIHCTTGATGTPCPLRVNGALVCIDGTCVETDGSRGSRCDPALHSADCGPGLACRPEGVCGDLFADGAECSMPMALWGNECASRCCAGDLTSGLPGVCTTYGPE